MIWKQPKNLKALSSKNLSWQSTLPIHNLNLTFSLIEYFLTGNVFNHLCIQINFRTPTLRPNVAIQEEILIGALSDILFKASDGKDSVVCMLGYKDAFDTDNNYRADGYTEKV